MYSTCLFFLSAAFTGMHSMPKEMCVSMLMCIHTDVKARGSHQMSSLIALYLLRLGLSQNLQLMDSVRLAGQPSNCTNAFVSTPPPPSPPTQPPTTRHWYYRHTPLGLAFYMDIGELNIRSHICIASTLLS